MIEFTVVGMPQQRGSKSSHVIRNGRGELVKRPDGSPVVVMRDQNDSKSQPWMDAVKYQASKSMAGKPLIAGAVELRVTFYFPRPVGHFGTGRNAGQLRSGAPSHHTISPDLDKLVRCLGDALTKVVWIDDKQVTRLFAEREWTLGSACTEVQIIELQASLVTAKSNQLGLALE
jgi:Holliday junction resolvase RusA-like endonuclease